VTWLLPLAVTVAAAGLTYWFCVRPMRRRAQCVSAATPPDAALDARLRAAREELAGLRASGAQSR
jgi:type II secretory pathway component PulM